MPLLRNAYLRHSAYYLAVLMEAGHLYEKGGIEIKKGLALFDRERLNINASQSRIKKYITVDTEAAEICTLYPDAGANLIPLRLTLSERIQWLEDGINAARQIGNHQAETFHTGNLGKIYRALGMPRRAIEYLESAIQSSHQAGDRRHEAMGLGHLAMAYCDIDEVSQALKILESALDIIRTEQDQHIESSILGKLGTVNSLLGNNTVAISFYEQQLNIAEGTKDAISEAEAVSNLGLCYFKLGQPSLALKFLMRASAIYDELSDIRHKVPIMNSLGLIYLNTNEPRRALHIFEQQEILSRQGEDPLGEGRALINQAEAYYMLGDRANAINQAENALAVYSNIESSDTKKVMARLDEWRKEV